MEKSIHNEASIFLLSILFLTQEKNQKNMHLKRIAKSSLRFGKKNNSSTTFDNNNLSAVSSDRFFFCSSTPPNKTAGKFVQILYHAKKMAGRRNSFNVRKSLTSI